jgi:hypothetical protein
MLNNFRQPKSIRIRLNIWAKTAENGEEAAKVGNISLPISLKMGN